MNLNFPRILMQKKVIDLHDPVNLLVINPGPSSFPEFSVQNRRRAPVFVARPRICGLPDDGQAKLTVGHSTVPSRGRSLFRILVGSKYSLCICDCLHGVSSFLSKGMREISFFSYAIRRASLRISTSMVLRPSRRSSSRTLPRSSFFPEGNYFLFVSHGAQGALPHEFYPAKELVGVDLVFSDQIGSIRAAPSPAPVRLLLRCPTPSSLYRDNEFNLHPSTPLPFLRLDFLMVRSFLAIIFAALMSFSLWRSGSTILYNLRKDRPPFLRSKKHRKIIDYANCHSKLLEGVTYREHAREESNHVSLS